MQKTNLASRLLYFYVFLFFLWQISPLVISGVAAWNDARFPSVMPWRGFTLRWFVEMIEDERLWSSVLNTLWVAVAVMVVSVPIGAAGGILLSGMKGRKRGILFAVLLAPLLTPETVVGISTLVFWTELGAAPGLHLSVLGQASGNCTFVMLLVLARLQSFDQSLEEAALDLGATHGKAIRHVLIPHITPALIGGGVMSMLLSMQNYNVTLFTRGSSETLMIYIGMLAKTGVTPKINALAFSMLTLVVIGAVIFEIRRMRRIRADREDMRLAAAAAAADDAA